jgi:hypothetical protein
MTRLASGFPLLAGGALALVSALAAPAAAQTNYAPSFQSGPGGWTHPFGGEFPPVRGSAIPVRQDPGHPLRQRGAELPIRRHLQPQSEDWAKNVMKKDNDEIDAGKIQFTANSSCLPTGVPMFMLVPGPFYFLQTPTKVVIVEESGHQARYIYLNEPHSANVKPSWLGESVGRYEATRWSWTPSG